MTTDVCPDCGQEGEHEAGCLRVARKRREILSRVHAHAEVARGLTVTASGPAEEPSAPSALERCVSCNEQYCDRYDDLGYPVHESCVWFEENSP